MPLCLAVSIYFSAVASHASELIPAAIMTIPVKDDPRVCLPQRFVRTAVIDGRVYVGSLNRHPDRRLWLVDDLVVFGVAGKFGYCDRRGVIRIKAIYDDAQSFAEARAVVVVNGKYGYIDTGGKIVVEPTFDWAYDFCNGLGCVQSGELWGIVDPKGGWVKRPIYQELVPLVGGIRATTVDGKEGWVDSSGNISRVD